LQLAASASLAAIAGCRSDSGDEVPTADAESSTEPLLTAVEGYNDQRKWEGQTLVVASSGDEGSAYLNAQIAANFEPFQRLTGATVRTDRADLAELRRQVNAAEVVWSVADVAADEVLPLANSAIVDEIDYGVVDPTDLFEPFLMAHGVGANLYSTVLAYQQEAFLDQDPPGSWNDFWNITGFPGFRGFQETPIGTLEFALLAGGVEMDRLYPLDVDLAFGQLDLIVDQIALWWRQGAQPTQMIAAGDLAIVAAWHDRIEELSSGGASVGLTWNQSQINGDCWVVPNGSPEREMAMDFVNFATRPEVMAAFSTLFPFGPANSAAYEILERESDIIYPGSPAIIDEQFVVDLEWWFRNREPVGIQFQEWLAQVQENS
jgi:putative spermidine/putrescine transport system substrate-binding protein